MSGRHTKRKRQTLLRTLGALWPEAWVMLALLAGLIVVFGYTNSVLLTSLLLAASILSLPVWLRIRTNRRTSLDRQVGLVLDGLVGAGFAVLHGVQVRDRQLDYVVVGPPGVFVVATEQSRPGAIWKGSPEGNISESLKELHEAAALIESRITLPARPLLVTSQELDIDLPSGELISLPALDDFFRAGMVAIDSATVTSTLTDLLRATTAQQIHADEEPRGGASYA